MRGRENILKMRSFINGECRGAKPLCRGFGGIPQYQIPPKIGGYRGLKTD